MSNEVILLFLADAILVTHVLFVLFVVLGLFVVYLGYFLKWHWVKNRTFRVMHFLSIGIIVVQSWFGIICPLTILEIALREEAGLETYSGSFIRHWLEYFLYYTAPEWVFITVYTLFGIIVAASLILVPPNPRKR